MKTASTLYVMVADSGRARVYRTQQPVERLDVVYSQENFCGQKNKVVQESNVQDQSSWLQTGVKSDTDLFSEGDDRFIRDISRVLKQGLRKHDYEALVMIAPAPLLDRMCRQLDSECLATLKQTIATSSGSLVEKDVIMALADIE